MYNFRNEGSPFLCSMYAQHDQSWHAQITPDQRMQNIQDTAQLLSMFADENSKEKVNNIAQRFEHSVFISATSLQGYLQSIQMKLQQLRAKAYGGDEISLSNQTTPLSAQPPVSQTASISQAAPSTPPQQQIPVHPPQMPHVHPPQELYQAPQQQFTRRQVEPAALVIIKQKTVHLASLLDQAQRILPFNKHILGESNWSKFTTIAQMYHQHIIALQDNHVVFLADQIDQVKEHIEKLFNSINSIEQENNQLEQLPPPDPDEPNWVQSIRLSAFGSEESVFEFPRASITKCVDVDSPDYVNPFNLQSVQINFNRNASKKKRSAISSPPPANKRVKSNAVDSSFASVGSACTQNELIQFLNISWNMAWRNKCLLPAFVDKVIKDIKENQIKPNKILFYCGKPNPEEWWVENDGLYLRIIGIGIL